MFIKTILSVYINIYRKLILLQYIENQQANKYVNLYTCQGRFFL